MIVTRPEADASAVALKPAEVAPAGTVIVEGTVSEGLLLAKLTTMFPAALERLTVHAVLEPAARLDARQITEEMAGVDHSVKVAVREEAPSETLMEAVVSLSMLPMPTLNVTLAAPAGTTMPAGTWMICELLARVIGVLETTGCDSTAVHELEARDITPAGVQVNAVT